MVLPDGRRLGYAEYGDPAGHPLVYFHGFPSSRLEASMFDREARSASFRLIAPDRPGFGLSTFHARRRITDWPADVEALMEHLNVDHCSILGCSGGTPYALACAQALPRRKISAVGLMSSAPPWEAGPALMSRPRRAMRLAATHWPSSLRFTSALLLWTALRALRTETVTRRLDDWLEKVHADAGTTDGLTVRERRENLLRMAGEGFSQGVDAFVQETQLLTQPWGFRFADVAYDSVQIWHGKRDTAAPVQMIRWMAERIPHCDLLVYEELDHGTMMARVQEVFSGLLAKRPPSA